MTRFGWIFFLVVCAVFFFALGAFSYSKYLPNLPDSSSETYVDITLSPAITPLPTPQILDLVKVSRVIDGDTVELEGGRRLRYIGMDTAELNQTGAAACFAKEAYEKNRELVEGKIVSLEKDVSETDKYGRLLRYVYLDGVMINEKLVKDGFAKVATFPPDVKYMDRFRAAEKFARENNLGLWSKCN
jgi:micrococcal nuclease